MGAVSQLSNDAGLISIIVPLYSVDSFMNRCLASIVCQTYSHLEIILIDDGSNDNCPKLCDEWAKRDVRVRVIHKGNGGLSSARNAGIELCHGDYIMFVDGDDYIEKEMIEVLVNRAIETDADMTITGFAMVDEAGGVLERKTGIDALWDERDYWSAMFNKCDADGKFGNGYLVVAWNKLYKRHLFRDERYDVRKIHEDEYIAHRLVRQCDSIALVSGCYYQYVQRDGSIVHSKTQDSQANCCEAWLKRAVYLSSIGLKQEALSLLKDVVSLNVIAERYQPVNDSQKTLKEIRSRAICEIRRMDLSWLGFTDALKAWCLCSFPRTYVNLYFRLKAL